MVFENGRFEFSIGEKSMTPPEIADFLCRSMECTPGLNDVQARLKDLDVEGVEKELIFPQRLFGLFMFGEMQNREEVFGLYNEAIARRCAEAPGRLYPVMVPNYWDMSKAKESVERCKALGARGLMVPLKPGKDVDGKTIHYNHGRMDPLYEAIADSGIPLIFHIGEAIPSAMPGAAGIGVVTQMQGFRLQWSQLTFGGVFDRFPALKVVFVEGGLAWIASMLHDADMVATHFRDAHESEARASAELVLEAPLLRDVHDRSGRAVAARPDRTGNVHVVVGLSAHREHVRLHAQFDPGGVRCDQRRERAEDRRQDGARAVQDGLTLTEFRSSRCGRAARASRRRRPSAPCRRA